jgi:hypothetical protein
MKMKMKSFKSGDLDYNKDTYIKTNRKFFPGQSEQLGQGLHGNLPDRLLGVLEQDGYPPPDIRDDQHLALALGYQTLNAIEYLFADSPISVGEMGLDSYNGVKNDANSKKKSA